MKSSRHGCTASSLHAPGGGAEGWLREVQSAFSAHHTECTQQVHKAGVDLASLQGFLDDAMSKLADAFSELASGQNPGAEAGARPVEVVVTTLQYHDICLQLLEHLRQRLEQTGRLIDQLRLPFEAVAAAAKGEATGCDLPNLDVELMGEAIADLRRRVHRSPVTRDAVGFGEVELFRDMEKPCSTGIGQNGRFHGENDTGC